MTMPTAKSARDTAHQAVADAQHTAELAIAFTSDYADDVLDKAGQKVRELRGSVAPVVDILASNAKKLARQSLDIVAEAKDKAQQSFHRYADVTTKYVSEQPVRSVLIAAAVDAAVALLVSSARNRGGRYSARF